MVKHSPFKGQNGDRYPGGLPVTQPWLELH